MTLLLESTIKASIIVVVALAILPFLRKRSAAFRHWVLSAALVCAAVAPAVGPTVPSWQLPIAWTSTLAPALWVAPPVADTSSAPASPELRRRSSSPLDIGTLVLAVWVTGAGVSAGVLLIGLARLRHLASSAVGIAAGTWADCAVQISREYEVRQPLVLQTQHPTLLVTWGVRQAKILLPSGARAWHADRVRLVLSHELAHARRGDWLVTLGAELLAVIYWFNPIVWIACRRLRQESEQACDDVVLNRGVEGAEYAAHLVDIVRELQQRPCRWVPAPSIARPSTLERRIRAMLDTQVNRRPISRLTCAATLLALALVTIPLTGVVVAQVFATVGGSIVDPTNGAVPGVTLVLTNTQSQAKYEVRSDRAGRYEFVGVAAGDYLLEANLPGFAVLRGKLTVAGQNMQQDLKLEVGSLMETINIRASATRPDNGTRSTSGQPLARRAAPKCDGAANRDGTPVGGNIRPPHKLYDVRPHYPASAVSAGAQGAVVLQARIGTDGNVEDVDVVSTPHPDLAAAAIDAIRQWQFDATYLNCVAIPVTMGITANFELER